MEPEAKRKKQKTQAFTMEELRAAIVHADLQWFDMYTHKGLTALFSKRMMAPVLTALEGYERNGTPLQMAIAYHVHKGARCVNRLEVVKRLAAVSDFKAKSVLQCIQGSVVLKSTLECCGNPRISQVVEILLPYLDKEYLHAEEADFFGDMRLTFGHMINMSNYEAVRAMVRWMMSRENGPKKSSRMRFVMVEVLQMAFAMQGQSFSHAIVKQILFMTAEFQSGCELKMEDWLNYGPNKGVLFHHCIRNLANSHCVIEKLLEFGCDPRYKSPLKLMRELHADEALFDKTIFGDGKANIKYFKKDAREELQKGIKMLEEVCEAPERDLAFAMGLHWRLGQESEIGLFLDSDSIQMICRGQFEA